MACAGPMWLTGLARSHKGYHSGMEQPSVFGLTIVGATSLLFVIVAWATAADKDVRDDLRAHPSPESSLRHPEEATGTMIERACPLCGANVSSKQDAGCPVIEAFGVVMAESKRHTAEGPTLP